MVRGRPENAARRCKPLSRKTPDQGPLRVIRPCGVGPLILTTDQKVGVRVPPGVPRKRLQWHWAVNHLTSAQQPRCWLHRAKMHPGNGARLDPPSMQRLLLSTIQRSAVRVSIIRAFSISLHAIPRSNRGQTCQDETTDQTGNGFEAGDARNSTVKGFLGDSWWQASATVEGWRIPDKDEVLVQIQAGPQMRPLVLLQRASPVWSKARSRHIRLASARELRQDTSSRSTATLSRSNQAVPGSPALRRWVRLNEREEP